MIFLKAIESILSILIMISIGYILTWKKWFDKSVLDTFVKIVNNISLPCLMVYSVITKFDRHILTHAGAGLIIPFLSIIMCLIIGIMIAYAAKIKRNRRGLFEVMFFGSNTIFVGLPVNLALFGEKSIPFALLYYIGNTTIFWTLGIWLMSKDCTENQWKLEFTNLKKIFSPPLLSFILSIIIVLLDIKLPMFVMDSCKYIGNLTTPLSMFFIGASIYLIDFKDFKISLDMLLLFFGKFIVAPITIVLLAKMLPIPLLMKQVFIIQSAMPIMAQSAISAQEYNSDADFAALMVTSSTVVSLVFIPVYMIFIS